MTLDNAESLLCHGKYLDAAAQRRANGAVRGPKVITCPIESVAVPGTGDTFAMPREYHIVNTVAQLKPHDWQRVVGVVALGAAWQFKDWPADDKRGGMKWNDPSFVFQNSRGFFLHFDDTQITTAAKTWNLERLCLSRTSRHFDKLIMERFWKGLGTFILHHKPELGTLSA